MTAMVLPDLAANEAVIERGQRTFIEVGAALADIRDRQLYSQPTFEAYVRERWGYNRDWAYQYIEAAEVVGNVGMYLQRSNASLLASLPVERQRELAPAIVDMTVREARDYVRAAEAPPEPIQRAEPEVEVDVGAEVLLISSALLELVRLKPDISRVLLHGTPDQHLRLRRLAQRAAQVVADIDRDVIYMER